MLFIVALVLGAGVLLTNRAPVLGQPDKAGSYSVVASDGAHIIVTDNGAAKLYFYAIDKDGKIGDELKLRGTVDLRDVGKASLKPVSNK